MTNTLRLMASAIALTFALPAAAEEIDWSNVTFTYADERCRDDESDVWCSSFVEEVTIQRVVANSAFSFDEFVTENNLPPSVTPETIVPAFRYHVMGYNRL